jgi:integrase
MLHAKQLWSLAVGDHADKGGVPGLYLQVSEAGRSWIFRFQLHKRRREMGLGSLADVSLAEARDRARAARKLRSAGRDPLEARKAERAAQRLADAKAVTFRAAAEAYIRAHEAAWRNAKHRWQWGKTLEDYAYPVLGSQPVGAIDTPLVLKALEPIWHTKPETAARVRGRIETVLASATARGQRTGPNPAQWRNHLDQLLPRRSKLRKVRHRPALAYAELPAFMARLRALSSVSARALEFCILCASRSGEVVGLQWKELDLTAKVWTVPAERMKGGREHRVPLSNRAVAILKAMSKARVGPYVFPGYGGGPLSGMALLMCMRRLQPGAVTVHGTARSSFRDWAAETTPFPSEVVEMALAHLIANETEAAYRRGDLLEKRRELMQAWADYAAGKAATTAGKPTQARKGHQRRA